MVEENSWKILISFRFLDKVFIINTLTKKRWTFPANKWLDNNAKDSVLQVTLPPAAQDVTTYAVKVKTSPVAGAGTYAKVKNFA
jgi:hypothetical protein